MDAKFARTGPTGLALQPSTGKLNASAIFTYVQHGTTGSRTAGMPVVLEIGDGSLLAMMADHVPINVITFPAIPRRTLFFGGADLTPQCQSSDLVALAQTLWQARGTDWSAQVRVHLLALRTAPGRPAGLAIPRPFLGCSSVLQDRPYQFPGVGVRLERSTYHQCL